MNSCIYKYSEVNKNIPVQRTYFKTKTIVSDKSYDPPQSKIKLNIML